MRSSAVFTPQAKQQRNFKKIIAFDKDDKLAKLLSACEQIDEQKTGQIKKNVFMKLLECLDIQVTAASEIEEQVDFKSLVGLFDYDRVQNAWIIRKPIQVQQTDDRPYRDMTIKDETVKSAHVPERQLFKDKQQIKKNPSNVLLQTDNKLLQHLL